MRTCDSWRAAAGVRYWEEGAAEARRSRYAATARPYLVIRPLCAATSRVST